jgi:hypothetical protein
MFPAPTIPILNLERRVDMTGNVTLPGVRQLCQ